MEGFFFQARSNLAGAERSTPESLWLRKVRVVIATQPLMPARTHPDTFETVTAALYSNLRLNIDYLNVSRKQAASYRVMPLGLAQKGPRRYLVCRSEGDDNERSLAIHRIQQAEASGLNFESTAQFSLACYDAEGQFGSGEGRKIQLSFCITREAGQHLLETPHCADQVVEKIASGL